MARIEGRARQPTAFVESSVARGTKGNKMSEGLAGRVKEGSPAAHGAIWDGHGTNFTLFSANATKVEVCLFDSDGARELERIALPEYTDQVWHGNIPGVPAGSVYGFRVSLATSNSFSQVIARFQRDLASSGRILLTNQQGSVSETEADTALS